MPRRGENIYKRKDKRWEGRYIKERKNGKAVYASVYAHSYQEIREKLRAAKEAHSLESKKIKAGTVQSTCKAWLSDIASSLKESSLNKYADIVNRYILPRFGDAELSDISNEQIIAFSNMLLSEGGAKKQGLSYSTVRGILSVMNGLCRYALRGNHTVAFTTACVDIKKEGKDIRVFSEAEEKKLLSWLYQHLGMTEMAILLSLLTGMRLGELCALTWEDIDLSESVIHVRKSMQRIRVQGNPEHKTEVRIFCPKSKCSNRDIPIPKQLLALLQSRYAEGAYITTGEKEKYSEPRTMENRFASILKKADIRKANFHAMRHTFATRCIEAGVDAKCLSEILGHASVSITLNRYVHPSMKLKRKNMDLAAGSLSLPEMG